MNKREVILGIVIVLIIVLAVVVGINISKSKSEPTNTEPTSNQNVKPTNTPLAGTDDPNLESPSPEPEETASPEATQTPSTSSQNKDISKMTDGQKQEYAKSIAKSNWEKSNGSKNVFYSYITAKSSETYIITVRDNATTNQLVSYEVNIKTGTCKETY